MTHAVCFSILEGHLEQLKQSLLRSDGCEHAAYIFFGNANIEKGDLYQAGAHFLCSHSVHQVAQHAILSSSPWEISWSTSDLIQKLKLASVKNLTLGIAHNHSAEYNSFSHVDDANEAELISTIQNRNGPNARLASILLTSDGRWKGRLWISKTKCLDANELRTVGERFSVETGDREEVLPDLAFLQRQKLALGPAFNSLVQKLKVTVVGCGGTGSAVAALLARLGVGTIVLIDNDSVEETNLNRLHGATRADAKASSSKVDVVARSICDIGLDTKVIRYKGWVAEPACRNLLKGSHIIFGCTDDNQGRILLNRFAYTYQIPVIDMGLAIQLSQSNSASIQAMDGRVTVLIPGNACLLCRGVIQPRLASEEALKRQHPEEYERRKLEAYVVGELNPNPAVVTFTTEVACMAVNEMIQRLQGYRGDDGSTPNRVRLFHRMLDLRPSRTPDPDCRVCGQSDNWSRGDIEPFLGIVS